MAPEIRRDDVPVVAQRLRRPVPVPAMIAPAVHEEERRLPRIAPVYVMQAQALRVVAVRGRSWHTRRQYHGLRGTGLAPLLTRPGMGRWHAPSAPTKRAAPRATTSRMAARARGSCASRSALARTAP